MGSTSRRAFGLRLYRALRWYGFALVAVIVAAFLRYVLVITLGDTPLFILAYPTIMLVALLGGLGPGLFATLLSVLIADYFILSSVRSFAIPNRHNVILIALFTIIGTTISWFCDRFRLRARRLKEFERAVEGLEEMMVVVDRDYRYVIANHTFLNYRGLKAADVIGRRISEVLNPGIFETQVKARLDECFLGKTVQFEMRYTYPDRGERDLFVSYFPIEGSGMVERVACVFQDITERKRTEAALRESEDRYRDLVEHSQDLVCVHDLEGRMLSLNPAPARLLGYDVDEMIKIPMREVVAPETRDQFDQYLERMKVYGKDQGVLCVVTRSGERRLWEYDNTLRTEGVASPVVRGMARDITEAKRVERALRNSERRYRTLFERTVAGVAIVSMSGRVLDCNDAWARMFGHERAAECHGGKVQSCYVNVAEREVLLRELETHGWYSNRELQLRKRDGTPFWVLASGTMLPQDKNEPLIQTSIIDITERKKVEEALRESQQRLTGIISSAMDAIITIDEEQRIVLFNAAAEKMFLCTAAEVLGQSIDRLLPDRFRVSHREHVKEFGTSGLSKRAKLGFDSLWARRANGEEFQMEASISKVEANGNRLLTVILRDITERNLAESALRKSEERFSKAFRNNPLAISISTRSEGRYLDVNDAFLHLLGYARKDVIGHTSLELKFWSEPLERSEMLRRLEESDKVDKFHTRYRTSKGELREAEMSVESVELDGQSCLLGITWDVTEIQKLEAQFRQAQKMEAVGRLAGGVAHDFNNVLGIIMGYSELSLELTGRGSPVSRYLAETKKAAAKAASLTQQLLAFSRKQVTFPRILDLNEVIRNTTSMFGRLVGEDITVEFRPGIELGNIKADPGQIEQVLMNLVVNARDAMPTGGRIAIETAMSEFDDEYVSQHPGSREGKQVVLIVSDTGCGMDDEVKAQIFEPFFTTKPLGRGTGLGLSTVYGIVKQSDGYIVVNSELGKGTTFKIYFPSVSEKVRQLVPFAAAEHPPRGTETILIVEDEALLREVTVQLLRSGGYKVVEAAGVSDALRILGNPNGSVDLLLTDVIMPEKSGAELFTEAKRINPKLRAVFMSGYAGEIVARHGVSVEEAFFLEKPFSKGTLLKKVYSALHSEKGNAELR